jgi:Flp pilus assembly protein TadD
MKRLLSTSIILSITLTGASIAQEAISKSVDIKAGTILQIKQYGKVDALKYPLNEQPFYGINQKTPDMLVSDANYMTSMKKAAVDNNKSLNFYAEEALKVGVEAIFKGDYATAARRINQAWLLDNNSYAAYYGMAVLVMKRDGDSDYGEYLFNFAKEMNFLNPVVYHDHAALNIALKKPEKALDILEQGAKRYGKDYPDYQVLKSRIYISQAKDTLACKTAKEINQERVNKAYLNGVVTLLEKCKSLGM